MKMTEVCTSVVGMAVSAAGIPLPLCGKEQRKTSKGLGSNTCVRNTQEAQFIKKEKVSGHFTCSLNECA